MGDITKLEKECMKCHAPLKEDEDVYCAACLAAEEEESKQPDPPEEDGPEDPSIEEDSPRALLTVFIDQKHGPYAVMSDGVTPLLALELLMYIVEDIKMSLTAAKVAQQIGAMARDAKTFNRLFKGAFKGAGKK
jgi:uncharacterized Zn finger protein (UPF0148 family)